jgi:hypothetical protein
MRDTLEQLEEAIITTTMELMVCGGTTPTGTYEVLLKEFPDVCRQFDKHEVITRCERAQQAEIPEESERFQELFQTFNDRYFGGRLPPYKIHVVYDVDFWANEYFFNGWYIEEPSFGYHDLENRRIFVGRTASSMEGALLHEMGHAATTGDHDDAWSAEMRRLQALGAPVIPCDVDPDVPADEGPVRLELYLMTVFTSKEIFGSWPPTASLLGGSRPITGC